MNTHMPTPDELLHAWIDDELDPRHEPQFFASLATDRDMRDRLRQLRTVRDEARRFGASAAPPEAATTALFARLGLEEKKERRTAAILPLFARAWSPVASAAAAAAITAMIFLGLQNTDVRSLGGEFAARDNAITPNSEQRIAKEPSAITDAQAPPAEHVPTHEDLRTAGNEIANGRASHTLRESDATHSTATRFAAAQSTAAGVAAEESGLRSAEESMELNARDGADITGELPAIAARISARPAEGSAPEAFADPVLHEEIVMGEQPVFASDDVSTDPDLYSAYTELSRTPREHSAMQSAPAEGRLQTADTRQYFPDLASSPLLSAFSVELRGMNTTSFPEATVGTGSNPWLENMAVGVYYGAERHDIGLEFGQEPFAMHYNGVEGGKPVSYQQNLLTPWLLATWRYRFAPIRALAGLEPYVQTGLGSTTQLWPMARGGFGLMYMPDARVRFHVGIEGSLMAYPYQSEWFSSRRLGLTYGLSVLM